MDGVPLRCKGIMWGTRSLELGRWITRSVQQLGPQRRTQQTKQCVWPFQGHWDVGKPGLHGPKRTGRWLPVLPPVSFPSPPTPTSSLAAKSHPDWGFLDRALTADSGHLLPRSNHGEPRCVQQQGNRVGAGKRVPSFLSGSELQHDGSLLTGAWLWLYPCRPDRWRQRFS
jgi:hypothetical protein